jgi:hypothetical protein
MKTFIVYFFIIGFVISVMLFNHGLYFEGYISSLLTWGAPGIYFAYKACKLGSITVPGPGICD